MKRASLLLLCLAGGSAWAQSSVTVFGVVDAHARYVKNGSADSYQLGSGGESTSRLGFRGTEDLGGGLKASFWLEAHLNADNGTAGVTGGGVSRFWHRRSTVSLSGDFGELRLGRDTLPTWTALSNFEVFGTVGVGNSTNLYPDANAFGSLDRVRADNAVAYFTPKSLGGFYGSAAVAAGEGTAGAKYAGGRIGYAAGPVNVTAAYGEAEVTADDNHKVLIASGSYDFGVAKLFATVQKTKFASAENRFYYLAATGRLGPGTLKASYTRTTGDGVLRGVDWSRNKADQFAIGYLYDLSKRTAVYTTFSYLDNKGTARYTVGSITGSTLAAGDNSRGFDLGIRHNF